MDVEPYIISDVPVYLRANSAEQISAILGSERHACATIRCQNSSQRHSLITSRRQFWIPVYNFRCYYDLMAFVKARAHTTTLAWPWERGCLAEARKGNAVCACLSRGRVGSDWPGGGGRSTLHTPRISYVPYSLHLTPHLFSSFLLSIPLSGFIPHIGHPAWLHPPLLRLNFRSLVQQTTTTHHSQSTTSSVRFSWIYRGQCSLEHHEYFADETCSRFILNLPDGELGSLERVCFQVEQASVTIIHSVDRLLSLPLPSGTGTTKTLCENRTQRCLR